jgi:hypothetical protein
MVEKLIVGLCGILCAVPFLFMSLFGRNGNYPLNFWSGDDSLEEKVADVKAYNRSMSLMYLVYGIILLVTACLAFWNIFVVIGLWCLEFSVGIYVLYRLYKKFLKQYGKGNI